MITGDPSQSLFHIVGDTASAEVEEPPEDAGRNGRDRVHEEPGLLHGAPQRIGQAEHALTLAANQKLAEDRHLAQRRVERIGRNDGATNVHGPVRLADEALG